MDADDVLYLTILIFSVLFGYVYRKIEDKQRRKVIGTFAGLLIVFVVSGVHIVHPLVTYLLNTLIIIFVNKRQCHLVSFTFSFLYLFFFRTTTYFGIPNPPAHTNLIQMVLTLKIVGLSFEINSAHQAINKSNKNEKVLEDKTEIELNNIDPSFIEIFHYCFNYVGVLTGPYYRYTTFRDYFTLSFSNYSPWIDATLGKLKWIPLWVVLYLASIYVWPLSYALTNEFYNERCWLYRLWYVWPNFFTFRMRIYIGVVLSECVCTMAGLGAYPVYTEPKPGHGPSKEFVKMIELSKNEEQMKVENYDFETIHNINPYGSEFCTTFRDAMKHWNICIQYWLAVNIYKRFPSKKFRTLVTLLVSAMWHGVYSGYYVCIGGAPFYLLIEDVFVKLYLKGNKGMSLRIWEWIIFFFKMFALSYLAIAFHLLHLQRIIQYYNSIYHFGLVLSVALYVLGLQLLKTRQSNLKQTTIIVTDSDKKEI